MAITEITIERTTGAFVFEHDQSDPPLTIEQAGGVAERFMDLLFDRLEEIYPDATIEAVSGNGLGGGTRVYGDNDEEEEIALATIQQISHSIYEGPELWSVVA